MISQCLRNFAVLTLLGIEDAKVKAHLSEDITPPPIHIEINDEAIDAMKCVNMLGETIYLGLPIPSTILCKLAIDIVF